MAYLSLLFGIVSMLAFRYVILLHACYSALVQLFSLMVCCCHTFYVRLVLFAHIPKFMEWAFCAHENQEKALHHFGHHWIMKFHSIAILKRLTLQSQSSFELVWSSWSFTFMFVIVEAQEKIVSPLMRSSDNNTIGPILISPLISLNKSCFNPAIGGVAEN